MKSYMMDFLLQEKKASFEFNFVFLCVQYSCVASGYKHYIRKWWGQKDVDVDVLCSAASSNQSAEETCFLYVSK